MTRESVLQRLLAVAQASYVIYQVSHWKVRGDDYYGNHLLLQRLYESAQGYTDQLGERMVGLEGSESLDARRQLELMLSTAVATAQADPLRHARAVTDRLLLELRAAYDTLAEGEALTLGLDDLLMSTASLVEQNLYLLDQALGGARYDAKANPGATSGSGLKRRLMR